MLFHQEPRHCWGLMRSWDLNHNCPGTFVRTEVVPSIEGEDELLEALRAHLLLTANLIKCQEASKERRLLQHVTDIDNLLGLHFAVLPLSQGDAEDARRFPLSSVPHVRRLFTRDWYRQVLTEVRLEVRCPRRQVVNARPHRPLLSSSSKNMQIIRLRNIEMQFEFSHQSTFFMSDEFWSCRRSSLCLMISPMRAPHVPSQSFQPAGQVVIVHGLDISPGHASSGSQTMLSSIQACAVNGQTVYTEYTQDQSCSGISC